jgi:hypothetical protein
VGTEQGTVVGYNSKQKRVNNGLTVYDLSATNKHHGPINSIQRNPVHTKFFLTVSRRRAKDICILKKRKEREEGRAKGAE